MFETIILLERFVKINIELAKLLHISDKMIIQNKLNEIGVYIDTINTDFKHVKLTRVINGIKACKVEKDKIKLNKYINVIMYLINEITMELDPNKKYIGGTLWD